MLLNTVPENFPSTLYANAEVASLSVLFVISLQTAILFTKRYYNKRVIMYLSGFMASILGFMYSIFKLGYWYIGVGSMYNCNEVLYVAGFLHGLTNAVAFLHLFQRADAVNTLNSHWPMIRVVPIMLIAANWATVLGVIIDRKYIGYESPDGYRCIFLAGKLLVRLKYSFELVNHIAQAGFFVWPLWNHLKLLNVAREDGLMSNAGSNLYRHMARRAIAGMMLSVIVTVVVTILVVYSQHIRYPTTVLAILDSSAVLGSIYVANCIDLSVRSYVDYPVSNTQPKSNVCIDVP